jgi:hypothetical protein
VAYGIKDGSNRSDVSLENAETFAGGIERGKAFFVQHRYGTDLGLPVVDSRHFGFPFQNGMASSNSGWVGAASSAFWLGVEVFAGFGCRNAKIHEATTRDWGGVRRFSQRRRAWPYLDLSMSEIKSTFKPMISMV